MSDDSPPPPPGTSTSTSRRAFLVTAGNAAAAAAIAGCAPNATTRPAERNLSDAANTQSPCSEGTVPITLRINGKDHTLRIDPRTTLLDCVRETVDLTGTKKGCD